MKNFRINERKFKPNQEQEVIDLYLSGLSIQKIANHFSQGRKCVVNVLIRNNITRRDATKRNKKYSVNENYFDVIDTEDKAYFLGLLITDGWVVGNNMGINLQEGDKEILETFKKCISYTGNLRKIPKKIGSNQYGLIIRSKALCEDLKKYGIVQNKTFKTYFPDISENLWHHFIRGCIDGDGWITIKKKCRTKTVGFCGNYDLVVSIQKILKEKCDLNEIKTHKMGNIYKFAYPGNHIAEKIINYLYQDATIYLKRKYEKSIIKFKKVERLTKLCNLCNEKHYGLGLCNRHYQLKRLKNKRDAK